MRGGLETRLLHLQPAELILPSTLLTERTDKILRNYAANRGLRIENILYYYLLSYFWLVVALEDEKYLYDIASFVVSDFYENQKKEDDDDDDGTYSNWVSFSLTFPQTLRLHLCWSFPETYSLVLARLLNTSKISKNWIRFETSRNISVTIY